VAEGGDPYLEQLARLDQAAKDAILATKYHLIQQGSYGKQYMSHDVYDAVLKQGVGSVEEFLALHSLSIVP
jgi:hypothetical protein